MSWNIQEPGLAWTRGGHREERRAGVSTWGGVSITPVQSDTRPFSKRKEDGGVLGNPRREKVLGKGRGRSSTRKEESVMGPGHVALWLMGSTAPEAPEASQVTELFQDPMVPSACRAPRRRGCCTAGLAPDPVLRPGSALPPKSCSTFF